MVEKMKSDLFAEHYSHKEYNKNCSTCFTEICKDCDGIGEVRTMESVYNGEDRHIQAPVGSEQCENCSGSGLEQDLDIINERKAEI